MSTRNTTWAFDSDNVIFASKPGAAPVAVWVSHEVIGLHKKGYGALLGEAVFSCVKVSAIALFFFIRALTVIF